MLILRLGLLKWRKRLPWRNRGLKRKKDGEIEKKAEKSTISRLLDGDRTATKEIFKQGLTSVQQHTKQKQELQQKTERDIMQMFEREESSQDTVQLSGQQAVQQQTETKRKEQREIIREQEFEEADQTENLAKGKDTGVQSKVSQKVKQEQQQRRATSEYAKDSFDRKEALKNYSTTMADYIMKESPQQKQKMMDIRNQMLQNGVSTRSLTDMDSKVRNMVRQHLSSELKNSILKFYFSKTGGKIGQMFAKSKLSGSVGLIKGSEALGGEEFGGYKGGLKGAFRDASLLMKSEIGGFLKDEGEELFVKYSGIKNDPKKFQQEFNKLQQFSIKAFGYIDGAGILKRIQKSIDAQGLAHFIPPEDETSTFKHKEGEGDERGKERKVETINYLSENDQLIDKLRNLYLRKSLNPGIKDTLMITFEIGKLKKQLKGLGQFDKELDKQLQKEAEFLAKENLLEDLKKIFIEQATLQKLSGPYYNTLRHKRAFILKTLHKNGISLTKDQINNIRDSANREMFPVIKEELNQLEMLEGTKRAVYATSKRKQLIEILTRIKEETKIPESIDSFTGSEDAGFVERSIDEAS